MYDVVALGELLVDFMEEGESSRGNPLYEANPGGAPCNLLSMLSGLGRRTAFVGKVGDDCLGRMLREALAERGIDTRWVFFDGKVHTTLAFVGHKEDGDREFFFYRNPGADILLKKEEICEEMLEQTRIFHFGTLSMTHSGIRQATRKAVRLAKRAGALISFDPNLRYDLWEDLEDARRACCFGIENCHILKISEDELLWLSGAEDIDTGAEWLFEQKRIPLVLVSRGALGSRAYRGEYRAEATPFLREDTVDTTGAGDCFAACILDAVLTWGIDGLDEERLEQMLRFANGAASIVTARRGALKVMPGRSEVEAWIQENT